MAWEKVKLNKLEQWVQDLPDGYDGVRVLADFFVHQIPLYDKESKTELLEGIIDGGWETGYQMMRDNLDEDESKGYNEAIELALDYYEEDNRKAMDSAIETIMQELFLKIFEPK